MNFLKSSLFAITASLLLASCVGSVAPVVSTPIGNIDTTPIKITPLTDAQTKNWPASDLVTDTIPGMSVDKAYAEIIKKQKGETVIVGVIDSGIDIGHEDLKNVIWTNKDEIPNNGEDDDNNGYVDDIHGWNFLGNVVGENMEYVRIIKKLDPKFKGKTESAISAADRADFELYKKAKAELEKDKQQTQAQLTQYEQILESVKPAHAAMSKKFGKADYSKADLASIESPTPTQQQQIGLLTQMFNFADTIPELITLLQDGTVALSGRMDTHFNMDKNFREEMLGDDPDNPATKYYGNNDVDGPDPKKKDALHGTHVAGIIAAERNNGLGMNGVANNVEIMVLRAVPDGDEYDKDIANAIRYAADNGAKVINASFGKYYTTHPEWVVDAIKYAESKDVLIVQAAGNEGFNVDRNTMYPNDNSATGTEYASNVLTVGAVNYKYGGELIANFSNFGKSTVDVFAPGVKIWSTTPLNTYEYQQGTSMASPAVAGVAAVIRSMYPNLSAKQVKEVIMNSGLSSSATVVLGGDPSNTDSFQNVSKTGRMVNLYNALIMASKVSTNNSQSRP